MSGASSIGLIEICLMFELLRLICEKICWGELERELAAYLAGRFFHLLQAVLCHPLQPYGDPTIQPTSPPTTIKSALAVK